MDWLCCIFQPLSRFFILKLVQSDFFCKTIIKIILVTPLIITFLFFYLGLIFFAIISVLCVIYFFTRFSQFDQPSSEDIWLIRILIWFHIILGISVIISEVYWIWFCCSDRFGKKIIWSHCVFTFFIFVVELSLVSAVIYNYDSKWDRELLFFCLFWIF